MEEKEKIEIERKFVILEKYHVPQLNGKLQTTGDRVSVHAAFSAMDDFAKQEVESNANALIGQILSFIDWKEYSVEKITLGEIQLILKEWCKQKSIEFAKWMDNERWILNIPSQTWFKMNQYEYLTGEQLYELYIQSK